MDELSRPRRDEGAVLLLVMVVAIVLSLVVLALANYVAVDLRYGQIVEGRANSLSTAHSGIDYAVARMRANQTLCATEVAAGAPVGLDGSAQPTVLPGSVDGPLNDSLTELTCQRTGPASFADVAGWAVVVTAGDQPDAIKLETSTDRRIEGPVYVSDVANIDIDEPSDNVPDDADLHLRAGDLWYMGSPPCGAPPLTNRVKFDDGTVRGPICTTASWDQIVDPPSLSGLPMNVPLPADTTTYPSCHVFFPGRYTGSAAGLTANTDIYLRSGNYWLDNVGPITIGAGTSVSAGHPGTLTPTPDACADARNDDPNADGLGATFFLSGSSQIWLQDGGSLEIFPRRHGDYVVSIRQLTPAEGYPSTIPGDQSLLRTWQTGSPTRLVVHGLVWSPANRVVLDNFKTGGETRLWGGVVALRFWLGDGYLGTVGDVLQVLPATSASDTVVKLVSKSTVEGVTTTVEAVVEYRPQTNDLNERVAVSSSRVVDD